MQVFTDAFRLDLWGTRRERSGWSWSLLTPLAQQAVGARLPQPLPFSSRYPATAYWANGAGVYASKADYERAANDVRFTAPYPLSQTSAASRLARAYGALLVGRVKDHFTPNQASSLEHAKRIGLEALAFVLDTLLIAVPGKVKFPGRALLFKVMFAKQLAVDLPLNLVQSKWEEVAETLVDFFETVLEMQASRKAGRLLKSRIDKLNQTLLPGRVAEDSKAVSALERLHGMLPQALRGLDADTLSAVLSRSGVEKPALDAMWQGKAGMDMALAASAATALGRVLIGRTPSLLQTPHYTQLPEAVEWPVVGWLASRLETRIAVMDVEGHSLRVFEPEGGGQAARNVELVRHDPWHYGMADENGNGERADSLFYFARLQLAAGQPHGKRDRAAAALREEAAEH